MIVKAGDKTRVFHVAAQTCPYHVPATTLLTAIAEIQAALRRTSWDRVRRK